MTGGFSRAIYYVETHLNWSTERILDTPLCRIRQLLELIMQEKREQYKFQAQIVEWQTKNLAAMFTVAARDSKQAREINKVVKNMRLPLGDEESDIKSTRVIQTNEDNEVLPTSNNVEENDGVDYIDLDEQPGFENLMSAFGDLATETIEE